MTDLIAALDAAAARYAAMTDEEKAAMWEKQKASWIRGMAPCEHGVRDWETCPDCRERPERRNAVMTLTASMGQGHWPPEQPRDELPFRVSHQEAARILANRVAREIAAEIAAKGDPSHLTAIFMWLRRIEDEPMEGPLSRGRR